MPQSAGMTVAPGMRAPIVRMALAAACEFFSRP